MARSCSFLAALGCVLAMVAGCEEAPPGPSEIPAPDANDSALVHEREVIARFLASSTLSGNCQVLHLFGSPNWVETGLCVASDGAQCPTSHPSACFNGRTDLDTVIRSRCAYKVNLNRACPVAAPTPAPLAPLLRGARYLGGALGQSGPIYAIGGTDAQLPSAEAYSPSKNAWTAKARMVTPRNYLAVTAGANGIIYAVGGQDGTTGAVKGTFEALNTTTNTWSVKPSLPTPRYGLTAARGSDGKIYVIGGVTANGGVATVEAYSPGTNTWSKKPSLPAGRWYHATAVAGGRIYVLGGTGPTQASTSYAYNPTTSTWSKKARPLAYTLYLSAADTGADGKIYLFGGRNFGGAKNVTQSYDPATNTWTYKAPMPTARYGMAAVPAGNGIIYVIGGATSPTVVEAYDPATDTWRR
jgi:N-acetylneuraminic acid mutarotase